MIGVSPGQLRLLQAFEELHWELDMPPTVRELGNRLAAHNAGSTLQAARAGQMPLFGGEHV